MMMSSQKIIKVSTHFETLYKMGLNREFNINKELIKNILNEDYNIFNVSLLCKEDRFSIYSRFRAMFRAYGPLKKQCNKAAAVNDLYNYFFQSLKKLITKIKSNKFMHKITIPCEIFQNFKVEDDSNISKILNACGFRWRNRTWHVENISGTEIQNKDNILKFLHFIFYKTNLIEAKITNNFMQFEIKNLNKHVDWNLLKDSNVLLYPDFETEIKLPILKASIQYNMGRKKEIIPHHEKLSKDINIDKNEEDISCFKDDNPESELINGHVLRKYIETINTIAESASFSRSKCLKEIIELLLFFCNSEYDFYIGKTYHTNMCAYTYQSILSSARSENNIYIEETIDPKVIYKITEFQADPDVIQVELNNLDKTNEAALRNHIEEELVNSITVKCNLCDSFNISAFKTGLTELRILQFHHFQLHYSSSLIQWLCSSCLNPLMGRGEKNHSCNNNNKTYTRHLVPGPPLKVYNSYNANDASSVNND